MIEADVAFVDVSVVPMTEETVLERHTVLVKDGVIVAIAPSREIVPDANASIVPGENRFLMPGLVDMHVHVWSEATLPLYVANGVTLVRNMWGSPLTLAMRERVESGNIIGPRIVTAGTLVDGDPPIWGEESAVAGMPDAARALMDEQRSSGFDFFKIYDLISLNTFDAIAVYSKEIDFPFAGHVPQAVPLEQAMRSGMSTIEHFTGWDRATAAADGPLQAVNEVEDPVQRSSRRAVLAQQLAAGEIAWDALVDAKRRQELAALAAETGIWHVPTLVVLNRAFTSRRQAAAQFARPEMRYIAPGTRAFWNPETDFRVQHLTDDQLEVLPRFYEENFRRVKALHDAGARLLVGTDAPNPFVLHGFSVHEELAFFVDAGLSAYDALVAATRAPAELLGDGGIGTVEPGKEADLVLLDANPIEDIAATKSIAGVSLRGRWLPRSELDAMLEAVAEGYAVPSDWFEGMPQIEGASEMVSHRLVFNGTEVGAERIARIVGEDFSFATVSQRRTGTSGDRVTETVRREARSDGTFAELVYTLTTQSGTVQSTVTLTGSTLTLAGRAMDGQDVEQIIELAGDVIVGCELIACMMPVSDALEDLAVGEERGVDVQMLATFGDLSLEPETWAFTRAADEGGARVYEGTVTRRSEQAALRIVVDANGWLRSRRSARMGVYESERL